jgi:hypothetical protein
MGLATCKLRTIHSRSGVGRMPGTSCPRPIGVLGIFQLILAACGPISGSVVLPTTFGRSGPVGILGVVEQCIELNLPLDLWVAPGFATVSGRRKVST